MNKKDSVKSDFAISGWIDPVVRKVLDRLEARSADEQTHLEQLRERGGSNIRDVASKLMLDVGSEVGLLLNLLVRLNGSRRIIEVGASVGYSTLWLAEAARATGGKVLTFEPDAIKVEELQHNLIDAGLKEWVEVEAGDAGDILSGSSSPIDFLFLDHWKELYAREFRTCWPRIAPGGMIVADNILIPAKNAEQIRGYRSLIAQTQDARSLTLSVGDGVELTVKCGGHQDG